MQIASFHDRQIAFPELDSFADIFEEVVRIHGHAGSAAGSQFQPPEPAEWRHQFTTKELYEHDPSPSWQEMIKSSPSLKAEWNKPMYVGPYITIERQGQAHFGGWAKVSREFAERVVRQTIVSDYDTMSWEVIEWPDNQALVLAKHGQIIGSVWVACVHADTLPTFTDDPTQPFTWRRS